MLMDNKEHDDTVLNKENMNGGKDNGSDVNKRRKEKRGTSQSPSNFIGGLVL
jgi:hypothetical protein